MFALDFHSEATPQIFKIMKEIIILVGNVTKLTIQRPPCGSQSLLFPTPWLSTAWSASQSPATAKNTSEVIKTWTTRDPQVDIVLAMQ